MPLGIHLIFVLISVIVLILGYRQKKQFHQLIMLVGILSTLLIYFVQAGISFYILAFEEVALFLWTIILMIMEEHRAEKKEKEKAQTEKTADENSPS